MAALDQVPVDVETPDRIAALDEALDEWRDLINAGHYFEAHEVLESPWLRAQEPTKTFLKGLIHVAVALYQYQRGNGHGARVKYLSARRYLGPYASPTCRIDLDALTADLERFFESHLSQPEGTPPPAPTHPWPTVQPRHPKSAEVEA